MALDLTLLVHFQLKTNNYFTLYPKTNNIRYPVLLCSIFYIAKLLGGEQALITKLHVINTEKEMTN